MANPKGYPQTLIPCTTHRPEPCTAQVNVRVPPSLKAKLKALDNWQEELRKAMEQLVEAKSA